jgi:hypothetical protein
LNEEDDMKTGQDAPELQMDATTLYREEVFTDQKIGTIRRMSPVKADGSPDSTREAVYVGQTQLLTPVGALPLSFEISGASLEEAVRNFAPAAQEAMERTMQELQELRREAASQIVVPEAGTSGLGGLGGLGGMPGGGKIKLR